MGTSPVNTVSGILKKQGNYKTITHNGFASHFAHSPLQDKGLQADISLEALKVIKNVVVAPNE